VTSNLPLGTIDIIARAYEEDLGQRGDVTTRATIPGSHQSVAHFVVRAEGCLAGATLIEMCLLHIDDTLTVEILADDGALVDANTVVVRASGSTRSLLIAERVALNLFGRLSGIATATRAFVDAVAGTDATITDTRKTTPGLRALEKFAVRMGGGMNHRMGLYDAVLIKDNHLVASASIQDAVKEARDLVGTDMVVEVEVDTLEQLKLVLNTSADTVLLDNMTPTELSAAVAMVNGTIRTEASGGVTLETVRAIAETGVDTISVGWLTHSAPSLDVAMDLTST